MRETGPQARPRPAEQVFVLGIFKRAQHFLIWEKIFHRPQLVENRTELGSGFLFVSPSANRLTAILTQCTSFAIIMSHTILHNNQESFDKFLGHLKDSFPISFDIYIIQKIFEKVKREGGLLRPFLYFYDFVRLASSI